MEQITKEDLQKLIWPKRDSHKGENGQLTIIGGSSLFHGAPLLALKTASRLVDMVFFTSPESSMEDVVKIKAGLSSFIWVDFKNIEEYIEKSDAVLIGPGMMREEKTRTITHDLLKKYPHKRWIIDAGALQMIEAEWLKWLKGNILITPHQGEFERLFKKELDSRFRGNDNGVVQEMAKKYNCVILLKGETDMVRKPCDSAQAEICKQISGGNAGLTKGGTGDVLAGLVAGLACKNDLFLSACAASYINKKAGEELFKKRGFMYNADDLAEEIPLVFLRELCED